MSCCTVPWSVVLFPRRCNPGAQCLHFTVMVMMKMVLTVEQLHLFTSQNREVVIFHVSSTGTSAPSGCTLTMICQLQSTVEARVSSETPRRTPGIFVGLVAIQLPGFTPAAASLCPQSSGGGDMIPPGFRTD